MFNPNQTNATDKEHKLMFNKASLSDLQPFFNDMITLKCAMKCVEQLTQSTQKAETQGILVKKDLNQANGV